MACACVLTLAGCDDDDAGSDDGALHQAGAIALLTRVCGPDTCQSYLNTYASLEEMQHAGTVDKTRSVEVSYAQGRVFQGSIYLFSRDEPTITRWTVADDLTLQQHETVSFANTGTSVFCEICNVFATPELAYHVDAIAGGVVVAWNPTTMELLETTDVPEGIMTRLEGGTPEVVFPSFIGGRAFYNASWANFDTLSIVDHAALVTFDASTPTPTLQLMEDERCGGTYVMAPFADAQGNVYAMGEAYAGYFQAGVPGAMRAPACLLRVKPGADHFDPDYYVDLLSATNAQAIRNAFPMANNRILLNILPASATPITEAAFQDDSWAYYSLLEFTYVVIDVETLAVTPVTALPPAAAGNSTPLALDGRTFIQVYPQGRDFGAHLYDIGVDGSVTKVIEAGSSGDFSMIGRVR